MATKAKMDSVDLLHEEARETDEVLDLVIEVPFIVTTCPHCNVRWAILRVGQTTEDDVREETYHYMQQIGPSMYCPHCGQKMMAKDKT